MEIAHWQLHYGDAAQEMTRLELETKLSKVEMVSRDYQLADILLALTEEVEWRGGSSRAVVAGHEESKTSAEPMQRDLEVLGEVLSQLP